MKIPNTHTPSATDTTDTTPSRADEFESAIAVLQGQITACQELADERSKEIVYFLERSIEYKKAIEVLKEKQDG